MVRMSCFWLILSYESYDMINMISEKISFYLLYDFKWTQKKHSFLQRVSKRYGSSNKVNNLDDLVYYARIEEDIVAKSRSSENFYENGCNLGTESRKLDPNVGNERSLRGLQTGRWPKLGSFGKNWIFGPKTEILGPKKDSLLEISHVLATTRKSCLFQNKYQSLKKFWVIFLG